MRSPFEYELNKCPWLHSLCNECVYVLHAASYHARENSRGACLVKVSIWLYGPSSVTTYLPNQKPVHQDLGTTGNHW